MGTKTATLDPALAEEPVAHLRGVEIFRAGDYGAKGRYTEADLDEMVATLGVQGHRAPLTLDHAENGPAYGWMDRVWREGSSLFADFSGVPASLIEAIKRHRYAKRSIEIWNDFAGLGKKVIRAVTLLGSSVPQVKGMADIALSERAGGTFATIDFEESALSDVKASPFPGSHGVIRQQVWSGAVLAHAHMAYLDEAGNGFTSPPVADNGYSAPAESGHVHQILAGVCQPSGDVPHVHEISGYASVMNEAGKPKRKVSSMSEVQETTPAVSPAATVDVATFEELKVKFEEANRKIAEMQAETLRRDEEARFSEAWGEAQKAGRVTPAERDAALKVFSALPIEKDGPRTVFLDSIKARPVVVALADAAGREVVEVSKPLDGGEVNHAAEIRKIMEAEKIENFSDAAAIYYKRNGADKKKAAK